MKHILILEDEISLAAYWQNGLETSGYQVTCCCTTDQAIEQISSGDFSLIITDMMIKVQGYDEFENKGGITIVAARAMGKFPWVPIIGVSGHKPRPRYCRTSPLQIAENMGVDLALYKPIRLDVLLEAVKTLLKQTESSD